MKKIHLLVFVCLAGIIIFGCSKKNEILPSEENLSLKSADLDNPSVSGKYIVVFNTDESLVGAGLNARNEKIKERAKGLLRKLQVSGDIEELYETALQGFTIRLAPGQVKKLQANPDVKRIEADQIVALSPIEINGKPGPKPVPEQIPWGITRVGGGQSTYPGNKTAWIIDTGIDLFHPDLNVDITRSVSFLGSKTTPQDQNGHGTHVSGIIAARLNGIGVVGVAPGARLAAVRVLNRSGSGTISGVIAGVNYVAANRVAGDVANMSLGGGISETLDEAVLTASKDIMFALAAGNESDNAANHSPARINGPNIYTVSAMDSRDKWASFSNFGNPPIDYCAPGVSVYSTYKDGGYATMSGTSMAAPHVAGLLLIGSIKPDGNVIGDPDGKADPIAHH